VIKRRSTSLFQTKKKNLLYNLTKNKAEFTFKKCKMEESSANDDNTQPLSKHCKKLFKVKMCSRRREKRCNRG
jgi:hypothetical protein